MRHLAIASVVIVISASLGISMVHAQSPSPKPKYPMEIAAASKLLAEKNEVCRLEARKLKLHFRKRRRFMRDCVKKITPKNGACFCCEFFWGLLMRAYPAGQQTEAHTMTDRVLLALALALLALTIAAVILYVAGVAPIFVG
jgi:hypothetical protein